VRRAGVEDGTVDEVIMGNVLQGVSARRRAARRRSTPVSGTIPALTVNKAAARDSGRDCSRPGDPGGDEQCIVAGGME